MPLKPGVMAEECTTPEAAQAEIQRLMDGIVGFDSCSIVRVTRVTEGWEALLDDSEDDFEYHHFWINDDGSIEWD